MKKVVAGWLQKYGKQLSPQIEKVYFADEIERLKEDIRVMEIRAKITMEKESRMYRGKTNLDEQFVN